MSFMMVVVSNYAFLIPLHVMGPVQSVTRELLATLRSTWYFDKSIDVALQNIIKVPSIFHPKKKISFGMLLIILSFLFGYSNERMETHFVS